MTPKTDRELAKLGNVSPEQIAVARAAKGDSYLAGLALDEIKAFAQLSPNQQAACRAVAIPPSRMLAESVRLAVEAAERVAK